MGGLDIDGRVLDRRGLDELDESGLDEVVGNDGLGGTKECDRSAGVVMVTTLSHNLAAN